jgi:hypothetical protein
MLTKKYCSKQCTLLGGRKELEKRSADRLHGLKIQWLKAGYALTDDIDKILFDSIADERLRQEGLLPLDEIPLAPTKNPL